jgi:hypothetical protein
MGVARMGSPFSSVAQISKLIEGSESQREIKQ